MVETLQHWLLTWLVGVVSGLMVSIPVGPINVTILNEGVRRGFQWAFLIGIPALCASLCVVKRMRPRGQSFTDRIWPGLPSRP